ncbi:bifunctional metallophosphatase/5'-nucleotidase, partial [Rubrimonas sp.]|uniref:bifunctional metallophosphatase/5'-nucleotidase n=1 Tax=Rubrimonas sp. TaxID=2036015 RepID=UPI002FDD38D6
EKQLAGLLRGVDVIVAGGSDTRLADATDRLREGDEAQGDYPFVTTDADGDPLLIVSTDGEYSYVGRLVVEFDADGRLVNLGDGFTDPDVSGAYVTDDQGVTEVTGAQTAQEAIDASESADLVEQLVDAVSGIVTANDANIFGRTDVFIEGRREFVRTEETSLGNLSADANLAYAQAIDPTVVISIKNGGGIRAAIGEVDGLTGALLPTSANPAAEKEAGDLSQLDIQNALRFNNGLTLLSLSAADLAAVLEHAVAATGPGSTPGQFPQVSGVRFSFDATRDVGDRIVNAGVFAEDGTLIAEIVRDGAVVENPGQSFRIVTLNFLADGGDSYPFPALGENRVDLVNALAPRTGVATFAADGSEQDAFAEYLAQNFAVTPFTAVETGPDGDERIQNLAFRADAVFEDDVAPDFLVINEIVVSTTGVDTEFLELLGEPGLSLDGVFLLEVRSGGVIDNVLDFSGLALGENGYFLAASPEAESRLGVTADFAFANNTFTNSAQTYLLVRGFTGASGEDIDADDDGVIDAKPW